jgi:hypothetical protein
MFVFFCSFINPFNTDVAATVLWYGAVFRINFLSDLFSDVSDVSCFLFGAVSVTSTQEKSSPDAPFKLLVMCLLAFF